MNDGEKLEQKRHIFHENLKNTTDCIGRCSRDEFTTEVVNNLKNSINIKENVITIIDKVYFDIKLVNEYINSRSDGLFDMCKNSRGFGLAKYNDETDVVNYLLYMHTYFMRVIIEYNYIRVDDDLITMFLRAINNYHQCDFIYENIRTDYSFSMYDYFIYTKNDFPLRLIKGDFQSLQNENNELYIIKESVNNLSVRSNQIINKFNEIDESGGNYILKFKSEMQEISEELRSGIFENVKIIKELESNVNEINAGLTFIGLEKAYEKFAIQKGREKKNARNVLKISIAFLFLPLLIKVISYLFGIVYNFYGYALTATATLLLLYLFRVSLLNYQSLKAELTQINLRRSLCMFIQGYTEFSTKHNGQSSLSKFESLVFSNVIPDSKKIPSTLDGLEQLAKLFESIKGKNS